MQILPVGHSGFHFMNDPAFFEGVIRRMDKYNGNQIIPLESYDAHKDKVPNLFPSEPYKIYQKQKSNRNKVMFVDLPKIANKIGNDIWAVIGTLFPFNALFVVFPFIVNLDVTINQLNGTATHEIYEALSSTISLLGVMNEDAKEETKWNMMPNWGPFGNYEMFTWRGWFSYVVNMIFVDVSIFVCPWLPFLIYFLQELITPTHE
jgi:hypothetical protein